MTEVLSPLKPKILHVASVTLVNESPGKIHVQNYVGVYDDCASDLEAEGRASREAREAHPDHRILIIASLEVTV